MTIWLDRNLSCYAVRSPPSLSNLFPVASAHLVRAFRKDAEEPPPRLTAASLGGLGCQSERQIDGWRHSAERHEQIALGLTTLGFERAKMKTWLGEVERKTRGSGKE